MTTYAVVRDDVDALIEVLAFHADRHDAEHYRLARLELSSETDPVKKAALFIYLNKTCFNGVYRVNKADVFNMGLETLDSGQVLDVDNLRQASAALQGVTLAHGDFSSLVSASGDFVYLDPPYDKTYTGYTTRGFDESFQRQVAARAAPDRAGRRRTASHGTGPDGRVSLRSFLSSTAVERSRSGRGCLGA